jgi:hypothetical protein
MGCCVFTADAIIETSGSVFARLAISIIGADLAIRIVWVWKLGAKNHFVSFDLGRMRRVDTGEGSQQKTDARFHFITRSSATGGGVTCSAL